MKLHFHVCRFQIFTLCVHSFLRRLSENNYAVLLKYLFASFGEKDYIMSGLMEVVSWDGGRGRGNAAFGVNRSDIQFSFNVCTIIT